MKTSNNRGIPKPTNLRGSKEHPPRQKKKKQNKVELYEEPYLDVEDRAMHAQILGEI
jgi:hypothetical protein